MYRKVNAARLMTNEWAHKYRVSIEIVIDNTDPFSGSVFVSEPVGVCVCFRFANYFLMSSSAKAKPFFANIRQHFQHNTSASYVDVIERNDALWIYDSIKWQILAIERFEFRMIFHREMPLSKPNLRPPYSCFNCVSSSNHEWKYKIARDSDLLLLVSAGVLYWLDWFAIASLIQFTAIEIQ